MVRAAMIPLRHPIGKRPEVERALAFEKGCRLTVTDK
jgi:hypothetical protein